MEFPTQQSAYPIEADETKHTIAVTGAGFAGYRFFVESLKNTINQGIQSNVRYVIMDPRPVAEYGRGAAWTGEQSDLLRVNMHDTTIIFDADGEEALLCAAQAEDQENAPIGTSFPSRKAIGEAIHHAFLDAIALASKEGIEFHLIEALVDHIVSAGKAYRVSFPDDSFFIAHSVVLALGHFSAGHYKHLRQHEGFIATPWRWELLESIESTDRIGILGLGPSAVDTLLVLQNDRESAVVGFSPSGQMQYPRPRPAFVDLVIVSEVFLRGISAQMGGLTVDCLIGVLAAEFSMHGADWSDLELALSNSTQPPEASLRQGIARSNETSLWFGLLIAVEKFAPTIWNLLRDEERVRFKALYRSISKVAYGMAPPLALQVLDALDHKRFETAGGLSQVSWKDETSEFEVVCIVDGQEVVRTFDVLIDCTGFGALLDDCPWEFIASMRADGLLFDNPRGGAVADFETGQLMDDSGRPTSEIYCLVGSLLLGEHLATNGLGKVAKSASRTAAAIHAKLQILMRTADA